LIEWIKTRFSNRTEVLEANTAAFRAGFNFGETAELFDHPYEIKPAHLPAGTYRNITGNVACRTGSSPPRSRRNFRSSTRRIRSPQRRTSCTNCRN